MKILHLIPTLSGGGAERQLIYLSSELVNMGHQVHVCFLDKGNIDTRDSYLNKIVFHQIKAKSNYDFTIIWQLIKIIRNVKPDIIQTWILQMDILGSIAARIFKIPVLLREPSSSLFYDDSWKNKLRLIIGKNISKIIISNSIGGDLYWKNNVPNSNRYIIRNGLPIEDIEAIVSYCPNYFSSENPIILYVGRLTKSKNIEILIKSFAKVKEIKKVDFIICGDGEQREMLEHLALALNVNQNIHFAGYLLPKEIYGLMKNADAFVSLSDYEGNPNSVLEAMLCECPLVVSDIEAHREILDERSALFVKKNDVKQISEAILECLDNIEHSKSRAEKAKETIKDWSFNKMSKEYENVYKSIVKSQIIGN